MKQLLITGMSGLIGGILQQRFSEIGGYELTALNRRTVKGVRTIRADVSDLRTLVDTFKGIDVIIHLAASLIDGDWEEQLNSNVIGTYNVFEAARLNNVKRVIFASSGSTVNGFERIPPYDQIAAGNYTAVPTNYKMITHEMIRPDSIYGATKVWGEALGRYFSTEYGISILCVRIGNLRIENRPLFDRENAVYLSHKDCATFFQKCVELRNDVDYEVLFATSNNKYAWRDLQHSKDVLGYNPEDSAEAIQS